MSDMLKRLLGAPDVKDLPTAAVELPRLSRPDAPFVVTVRTLNWKQINDLHAIDVEDAKLKMILSACPELAQRLDPADINPDAGILTAEDVLRQKLLPGEIERLVEKIERLCGYRGADIVREIKN